MRPVSNLSIASHAWAAAIDKINEMAYVFSTAAVTLESNTTGAVTTGNGWVNGSFAANTMIVIDGLRGGTVAAAANLTVTSNLLTSANVWLNGAIATVSSNVSLTGANLSITGTTATVSSNVNLTGANLSIAGTNTAISSNLNVTAAVTRLTGATTNVTGTTFNVSANVILSGANISITTTNAAISGNLNVIGSVTSIAGPSLSVTSNVAVNAANVVLTTTNTAIVGNLNVSDLSTLATVNVTSTAELRGVTTAYANVIASSNAAAVQVGRSTGRFQFFGNNANFSGTLDVTGISTFSGNVVAPTANINVAIIGSITEFAGFSNANLGSNITHNQLITSFSASTYRAGKVTLWFKDTANNSQRSELVFSTNSTAVDFSIPSVLYTTGSQLVSNTVAVWNAGTVEIYAVQSVASTSVKGTAELIRG